MTKEVIQKSTTAGAKKRLRDVTFDHDTAHLALCSKEQGAANNQEHAIVLKSKKFSPELIAKAQRVQVTMELPEFLRKFFDMWYDDAEVLARLMGYVPEESDYEPSDWIQDRVDSFVLLKSIHEADDQAVALAALTEAEYSTILDDQEKIMKSMKEFESHSGVDNSAKTQVEKVEPVGSKQVKKGKKVTTQVEMIEKSAYDSALKQANDMQVELQKAREALEAINKEKAEMLIKSRSDALKSVLADEKHVEAVMKSAGAADAEAFAGLVEVFKSQADLLAKADLFKEKGVTVQSNEEVKENKLADLIKAKYAK